MQIIKENILGMLGEDSRRYHSCIATTFTFDFTFFEIQAMRLLKAAGIRNTLVLIDEDSFEELMDKPTGFEFRKNIGYGVYPFEARSVFHPKLIFCAGRNEGFLAIGSGNLTIAGHGTNDELWSVFHYKGEESPNKAIFKQAWNYIQTLSKNIEGNSLEKIARMEEYAPWISSLPQIKMGDFSQLKKEQIALNPVMEGDSLIDELPSLLDVETITEINILSPYYDEDGLFLEELEKLFPDAIINAVVDVDFGLLPYNYQKGKVNFYNWQKVNSSKENDVSRLHAKLIAFKTKNNDEFIISGSSNATCAGFGVGKRKASNKELNLFIKKQNSNIFKDLGIKLTTESKVNIAELHKVNQLNSIDSKKTIKKVLKIKYAEIDGTELSIGTFGEFNDSLILKFFNKLGNPLNEITIKQFKSKEVIKLDANQIKPFFVAWFNSEGEQLSTKMVIQDTALHHNSNPDPDSEKIESLFADIDSGNFGQVSNLLRYVTFSSNNDQNIKQDLNAYSGMSPTLVKETAYTKAKDYNEFTKVSEEYLMKQRGVLNSTNVKIAEFLATIRKKQLDNQSKSIKPTEQIDDIDNDEGVDDEKEPEIKTKRTHSDYLKEKSAISRFLNSYEKHLKNRTKQILETKSRTDIISSKLSLDDYANLLISLQLVKNYTARQFKYIANDEEKTEVFFKLSGSNAYDNLKSFVLEIIGSFLLLLQQGDKESQLDSLNQKVLVFKKEALLNCLVVLCNVNWKSKEENQFKLLAANCLFNYLLIDNDKANFTAKELDEEIMKFKEDLFYTSQKYNSNFDVISNRLLIDTVNFSNELKTESKQVIRSINIKTGNFVYVSKLGICSVEDIRSGKIISQQKLTLAKPGFLWEIKKANWLRDEVFISNVLVDI